MTSRRAFLLGIGAALAAPAIVKAESLMKIAAMRESVAPLLPYPPAPPILLFTKEMLDRVMREIAAGCAVPRHFIVR